MTTIFLGQPSSSSPSALPGPVRRKSAERRPPHEKVPVRPGRGATAGPHRRCRRATIPAEARPRLPQRSGRSLPSERNRWNTPAKTRTRRRFVFGLWWSIFFFRCCYFRIHRYCSHWFLLDSTKGKIHRSLIEFCHAFPEQQQLCSQNYGNSERQRHHYLPSKLAEERSGTQSGYPLSLYHVLACHH